jgi:hypothetical protein
MGGTIRGTEAYVLRKDISKPTDLLKHPCFKFMAQQNLELRCMTKRICSNEWTAARDEDFEGQFRNHGCLYLVVIPRANQLFGVVTLEFYGNLVHVVFTDRSNLSLANYCKESCPWSIWPAVQAAVSSLMVPFEVSVSRGDACPRSYAPLRTVPGVLVSVMCDVEG